MLTPWNKFNKSNKFNKKETLLLGGLILLILGLAFGLRVALLSYGLPFLVHEDESIYLSKIMAFGYGDFDPDYFKKPTFFLYFHFAFFYLHYLFGLFSGAFTSWASFETEFWQGAYGPVLWARSLTVVFSTASVALLYVIGKRVFSTAIGLGAAFLLAVHPTHIKYTPILISDIPALFFILLTCWFALEIYEKGRWRDYLGCAVAIGLTMSFKYNFFVAGFLISAHVLRCWPKETSNTLTSFFQSLKTVILNKKPWLALLGAGLVFMALSPYVILNFERFYEHFTFERDHVIQRSMGLERTAKAFISLPKLLFKIMPRYVSWPLHVLNLLGILLIGFSMKFKKEFKSWMPSGFDWKKGWILLSFPVVFFLVIAQFRLVNAKYLLPMTPFLLLFGATFGIVLLKKLAQKVKLFQRIQAQTPKNTFLSGLIIFMILVGISQPLWIKSVRSVEMRLGSPHILHVTQQRLKGILESGNRVWIESTTFPPRNTVLLKESFSGVSLLQVNELNATAERVKAFQPDYVLINPKPIKDDQGHKTLRFSPDYYAYLRQHFETFRILTPYGIEAQITYPADAEDYLALYQAVEDYRKTHQNIPRDPSSVLLLLKKSRYKN